MNEATNRPESMHGASPCAQPPGLRASPSTALGGRTPHPASRRLRRGARWTLACLALTALAPALAADAKPADAIVVEPFPGVPYAELREALADAIANEGLTAPVVSQFARMLERTAADLGHAPTLYADAEILTFCSAGVAARLVAEARERIALCPLSIAVYSLAHTPQDTALAYRPPTLASPGAEAARALMARIVDGTASLVGRR